MRIEDFNRAKIILDEIRSRENILVRLGQDTEQFIPTYLKGFITNASIRDDFIATYKKHIEVHLEKLKTAFNGL